MATGSYFFPSTHCDSHCVSCGHTLPHTAGRLFFDFIFRAASTNFPSFTRLIKSGIGTSTGHPLTQSGLLHCRRRSASCTAVSSVYPVATSPKFLPLSFGSCDGMGWRGVGFMVISPFINWLKAGPPGLFFLSHRQSTFSPSISGGPLHCSRAYNTSGYSFTIFPP